MSGPFPMRAGACETRTERASRTAQATVWRPKGLRFGTPEASNWRNGPLSWLSLGNAVQAYMVAHEAWGRGPNVSVEPSHPLCSSRLRMCQVRLEH